MSHPSAARGAREAEWKDNGGDDEEWREVLLVEVERRLDKLAEVTPLPERDALFVHRRSSLRKLSSTYRV